MGSRGIGSLLAVYACVGSDPSNTTGDTADGGGTITNEGGGGPSDGNAGQGKVTRLRR